MIRTYLAKINKMGQEGAHILTIDSESNLPGRNAVVGIKALANLTLLYDRSRHFEVTDDPEIRLDFERVSRGERVEGIENYGVKIPGKGIFLSCGRRISEVYCITTRWDITKKNKLLEETISRYVVDERKVMLPRPVNVKTLGFEGMKDREDFVMGEILENLGLYGSENFSNQIDSFA